MPYRDRDTRRPFKYTYDREAEAFKLSGRRPTGLSFPLDFGLAPRTLADDGDALDILGIADEPAAVGYLTLIRLLVSSKPSRPGVTVASIHDRLIGRLVLLVSTPTPAKDLEA